MIRPYTDSDFDLLTQWIPDADALFQFSGPGWHFPLTREQMYAYQAKKHISGLRQFYVGYHEQGLSYAFGEIINGDAHSPRLGRILLDPAQRGKGLGEQFMRDLVNECIQRIQPPHIYLFVLDGNTNAIRCYEKIGFRFDGVEQLIPHAGQEERMRRMVFRT